MLKHPTIKDLAEASGVSTSTVDRVLNGRESVRAVTAMRVHEAARRLGFHIGPAAEPRAGAEIPSLSFGLLLPPNDREYYDRFVAEAQRAAGDFQRARIKLTVRFIPDMAPDEVCQYLDEMSENVQAIGVSVIDHPKITRHVQAIQEKGIPVIALLSDFAQGIREAYVGTNNLKVGRTAAAMLAYGIPRGDAPTEVALFVGGHRWHGHDLRETGFRAWFRENRPDITVLDTNINLNTGEMSYESMRDMLSKHARLRGVYCAGGGREGLIRAIREAGSERQVNVILNEVTDITREALTEGLLAMIIDTPAYQVLSLSYACAMDALHGDTGKFAGQHFVPMNLVLPESI